MTSFMVSGYFALSNGRRVSSENPNTHKLTHHVLYDTVVQTSGTDLRAELRAWSPANDPVYPDGTVVDVLGKVYAPSNAPVLVDVLQMVAFPGDASADDYEDKIPDRPFATFFVLGHTNSPAETADDTISVAYFVQTADYVRDQTRSSRVYCRFDGSKPRWKKTPRPQPGVAVFIVGLAHGLHLSGGNLILDVDQVQLNVGGTSSSSSAPRVEAGGSPAKRRKFPLPSAAPATSDSVREQKSTPETVLPAPAEGETSDDRPVTKSRRTTKRKLILDEAEEAD